MLTLVTAHELWPRCDFSTPGSRCRSPQAKTPGNVFAVGPDEVIATAEPDRRPWLRKHLGKRICSITSAVVALLSAETHREGFAPAVPFVSCFSACMMVTELVRFASTGKTLPEPRYQLNLLWGPRRGMSYDENRRADCVCVERRDNISRWRARRRSKG